MSQSFKEALKEKIAQTLKENLKGEEGEFVNPWSNLDKAAILQQTRCFASSPIDSEECLNLLTRILYVLQQGEKFTESELTSVFFGVTKLFHTSSSRLRRMVYLVVKELEPSEQEVFIVMSCLIKDLTSKNDSFRANSVRVMSRVLDPTMAAQIDRYLKTAIVDKHPFVSSASLVCGIHLLKSVPDVVKRWVNEIQEQVNSQHPMVQFHALALLYDLKKGDRLALHKVITSFAKGQLKSPLAECSLIRYATQTLMAERDSGIEKTLMTYMDNCLRHKNEMVMYEAAKSFCQLAAFDKDASANTVFGWDVTHATTVLQIFLTSPKHVVRYGAIKTLNLLAQTRPSMAARCNSEMEVLLSDANRNIATLALTTLLKTGHESSVERLVKQITTFMSDISDAFKIEVVRAVKGLCLMYPAKHKMLMSFLSSNLREDGSAEFKADLVDALILIIGKVPAARDSGLLHLHATLQRPLSLLFTSFVFFDIRSTMVPGDLDRNFDFVLGERQSNTYKARKAVAPAGKGRLYRQQRTPKDATFKNRRPRLPTEAIRMRIPDTDELEEAFDALRKLEGGSLASVPQAQVNLSYCDSRRDWRNLQDIVEKRYGRQIREELGGATELLPVHPEEEVQRHFLQTCSRNPHALSIGYHGTKSKNYEGIARRGLLVPSAKKKGPGSGVRVTNGSAHGVGVYTATFGHADLSRGFSDTGAVFVCAICDTSYLNQFEPDAEVTDPIRVSTKTLANTQKKGLDVHRASSQVLHVGDAMVIYDQHFVVPLFLAKPAELLGEVGFKAWEAPHQIGRRRIVVPKEGDPGVIYGNARERRGEAVWIPVLPLEGFTGKLKTVRRRFERRWREKGLKYRDDKYLNWDYLC